MNILPSRRSAAACAIVLIAVLSSGCAVDGDGYNSDMSIGLESYDPFGFYEPGFYDPYGAGYGGWGPGYYVGPFGHGGYGPYRGDFHPPPHAYRSARPFHPVPSIPSRSRFGGVRRH
jgi:hypothetical protein